MSLVNFQNSHALLIDKHCDDGIFLDLYLESGVDLELLEHI